MRSEYSTAEVDMSPCLLRPYPLSHDRGLCYTESCDVENPSARPLHYGQDCVRAAAFDSEHHA